jgi:hypothetical protein
MIRAWLIAHCHATTTRPPSPNFKPKASPMRTMIAIGALTPSRANSARIALVSLNGQGLILQELKVGSNPTVSAISFEKYDKYHIVMYSAAAAVLLLVLLLAGAWGGSARTRADSPRAH